MSFLASALFAGLIPLVAAPVIVHFLNKRYPQFFAFPTIKNLQLTVGRRSWLYRNRHRILMLLRTIFLILLLLVFLKPVLHEFGDPAAAKKQRQVVILFDHSLSMEHLAGGVRARRRGIAEARKIVDALDAGDLVNVVAVDHKMPTCFIDLSTNHREANRFIEALGAGASEADFTKANAEATRLLKGNTNSVAGEIYYVSDFQRKNWANVDFSMIPPQVRLFFVDVAKGDRANRGILNATIDQSQLLTGAGVMVEVTVGNYSDADFNGKLTGVVDRQIKIESDVIADPWSQARVRLLVPAGKPGIHRCELRLPDDSLPEDNRYFFTFEVREKDEVLILSDPQTAAKNSVFFLQTALNPYADKRGSILPSTKSLSDLTSTDLAGVSRLFITGASRIDDEKARMLARFLFDGGGIIYFLDSPNDPVNLDALGRAASADFLPLKLGERREAKNVGSEVQQILRGEFRSRFLKMFEGSARQDLSLLEFYDFYSAVTTGNGQILLHYADETPAMAASSHGLGTMLFMNFSVGELSSNLARQRAFPAWIQFLVHALSIEEPRKIAHQVGGQIEAEVWRTDLRSGEFLRPDGKAIQPRTEARGERYAVSFPADRTGFYQFTGSREQNIFAVNSPAAETDLRQIDQEELPKFFDHPDQDAHFIEGATDFRHIADGRPIFHWFLFGAVLFLMLETGFQGLIKRVSS